MLGQVAPQSGILIDGLYLLAVFAGSGAVIAFLFRMLMQAKDDTIKSLNATIASNDLLYKANLTAKDGELADEKSLLLSLQDIAREATKTSIDVANFYRQKFENKSPLIIPAQVIPESHSPPTENQRIQAEIATFRAVEALIRLEMKFVPRPEGH